jgi:FAD:protein FMN transferase
VLSEPGPSTARPDTSGPRALTRRELLTFRRPARASADSSDFWIRVHRRAMACRFEIAFSGEDGAHTEAARDALDEVDRIESALTVFRESSDLVRVNRRAAQAPVPVDGDLVRLLSLCRTLHEATDGTFDVTTTPLSRAWGFLKREGRLPSSAEIAEARARVGMDGVQLDGTARTVRFLRAGLELNLGSIGKGWALDRAGALLRSRGAGHALLSAAGSSVLALGGRDGGWRVDVRSRQAGNARLFRLRLTDCALGTSGAGEQFVEVDGRRYGHVLDPRTGWPASGVLSASVVASEAAVADALSTAFLVGGPEVAARYCESHPGTLAFVTPDDGASRPCMFGAHAGATLEEA